MKFFVVLSLVLAVFFLGFQAYRLYSQQGDLVIREKELREQAGLLAAENRAFTADIEYFKNDYNLTKELRSKFNYRQPNEKMFMLSPADSR
jgi:cell division protein FtsB